MELYIEDCNMQAKDWILLFFPVLCNGFFLFTFTQLIELKVSIKQQFQIAYQEIIHEYLGITKEILQIFCIEDKQRLLFSLNEKLPYFFSFSKKNMERLCEYTQNINRIKEVWFQLVDVLNYVQDNEDGIINGVSSKKVTFLVGKLFEAFVEISQKCISDIYERGDYSV